MKKRKCCSLPSTRVLCATNPPKCKITRSLGKIWVCLGGSHPGRVQAQHGKEEDKDQNTNALRGAIDRRLRCHGTQQGCHPPTYGGHPLWCIVQPMDFNQSATLRPKPKPDTPTTPPKATQPGDDHWVGWKWQPSPMSTGFHPNCSHGGSQSAGGSRGGSGQRPCITEGEGWFGQHSF